MARKLTEDSAPRLVKRRSKAAAPLGFVILLLTVIGFFTVIAGGTRLFHSLTDQTAQKQQYAQMLNPIVMLDPPNFDDPSKLNQSLVLQTNLWAVVQDGDLSRFQTDEEGRILIPLADLDVRCRQLYGGLAAIPRVSMTADGEIVTEGNESEYSTVIFEYLPEYDSFAMPVMGEIGTYYPSVEDIQRDGDFLYLTVAYHPLQSSWYDAAEQTGGTVITKYKIFTMQKSSSGDYFVLSLKDPDVEF